MVERNGNPSDYYYELVSIEKLYLDPKNPRIEDPSKDLLDSVREDGVRKPLITWLKDNDHILICDGYERYQAGIIANLSEIPCHIYKDHLKALKETKIESIVNPWTKYQKCLFCKNVYDACIEEGMTDEEALQKTNEIRPARRSTIRRYLRVMNEFPLIAQSLLKKPRNRSKKEWNELESYNISFKKKILNISIADLIVQTLHDFSEEKICQIAVDLLGLKNVTAKRAIYRISQNPDKDPFEIITKVAKGYNPDRILHIGSFIVEPTLKKAIGKYISTRLITSKGLVKELLEDWLLSTGKYSIVETPNDAVETEMKSISFKFKGYIIKIFLIDNFPIIKIEGKPSLFFSHQDVIEKVWNRYSALPQYLKDFRIEHNKRLAEIEGIDTSIKSNLSGNKIPFILGAYKKEQEK